MKKTCRKFAKVGCAIVVGMVISHNQPALAGWTGLINGVGKGWASVNVRSSTLQTNRVTTLTNTVSPSAAMAPTTGYLTNAPLPSGAATNTYSRIKGLSGGIWQAAANAANGDGTDNAELESRVAINPADCASLTLDSSINQEEFQANGHSGTIRVNTTATSGTALWLRGFEYAGDQNLLPPDDPDTTANETIEFLKVHGVWKFETLIVGPFDFSSANGNCPLLIPFTLNSTNLEHLIFAVDGVAKSLPLIINCPAGVVVQCTDKVFYPPVTYAGCGNITISYSPALPTAGFFDPGYFPVGVTPVTVTATDTAGNTTNCTFTVTVQDTAPPVIPVLPVLTGQCSVNVAKPTTTDNCAGTIAGTTSDPLTYNIQGTFAVHWSFNDGNGNTSTANQTVIVKDTIPPVAPVLATVTGSCSAPATLTAPTTTDNCAGTVTGTTSDPLVYSTVGENIVHWTFSDGNGNSSTANQTVIVTGLAFKGFYSPIGTVGNLCTSPVVANQGSVVPVKFDIWCGTTYITTGQPPTVKIQLWTGCAFVNEPVSVNAVYQNDWHYNWDTSRWAKGLYKVVVILPDGTTQYVFVKLK